MKKWMTLVIAIILGGGVFYTVARTEAPITLAELATQPQQWQVKVPDTTASITLNSIKKLQQQPYLMGEYQTLDGADNVTIYLNANQAVQQGKYIATSFVTTNSGSGTFYYLSVFEQHNKNVDNLTNIFIGDRINIEKITIVSNNPLMIKIDYKTHGENTPYALPADVAKSQIYQLKDNQLVLQK
ncbi:hypothetical protein VXS02_14590 [Photobacterium piscicola]|uniref:hypothetical protein n=1 Tax=Photobacterium piscicola TaxID=1378299 RepID=UPI002E17CBDD|nr:hypothetical protein [Photobacterium piscicola]